MTLDEFEKYLGKYGTIDREMVFKLIKLARAANAEYQKDGTSTRELKHCILEVFGDDA